MLSLTVSLFLSCFIIQQSHSYFSPHSFLPLHIKKKDKDLDKKTILKFCGIDEIKNYRQIAILSAQENVIHENVIHGMLCCLNLVCHQISTTRI